MKITINSRYLVFPVNTQGELCKLTFSLDGEPQYAVNIKIDTQNPDYYAYLDLSRYEGRELEMTTSDGREITFRASEEIDLPDLYREDFRPLVHFTTKNGWINDPNGLVYHNGLYHMFYQYNPAENVWENMHWGHAVSRDLIHWEEKPAALFPDLEGTMYSGSAIVDEHNLLGKNTEDSKTGILFYTKAGPFDQCMAYSTDGFVTIQHDVKNPILPNVVEGNRDPNVRYCEELGCYVMMLYLDGHTYGLYRSDNLTDWQQVQTIEHSDDWECPDFFPTVNDRGERRWVFIGARYRYLVGVMEKDGFKPIQEPIALHFGGGAYAGQTFSGLPDGRIVRVDWDIWEGVKHPRICGQMGMPVDVTLHTVNGVEYLAVNPVKEIASLYGEVSRFSSVSVTPDAPVSIPLADCAHLVTIQGEMREDGILTVNVFGRDIVCDFGKQQLFAHWDTAPLTRTGAFSLTVLMDRLSMEMYIDGGLVFMGTVNGGTSMERDKPWLTLSSDCDYTVSELTVVPLRSIWE